MVVKLNFNAELSDLTKIIKERKMETSTPWVIYLSGPMTGIPQFNYPAFTEAAKRLREAGYSVINPAEVDDAHTQKLAMQSKDGKDQMPWGQLIGRDISILSGSANELTLLPGWEDSRGALMEALASKFQGIRVTELIADRPLRIEISGDDLVSAIEQLLFTRSLNVHQAHQQTLLQARV